MKTPNFDRAKYDELLSHGLPKGVGTTDKACIMACLNLACGGELTDAAESPCVLAVAARFAIRLNDAKWSSEVARADGLHDLGLALLGTSHLDRLVFLRRLAEQTIRQVAPVFLRRAGLEESARRCEDEGTRESAQSGRDAANKKYAADCDADAAAASSSASAAAYAAYAAAADCDGAYAAYAAYGMKYGDETLILSAKIATEILNDMKAARP